MGDGSSTGSETTKRLTVEIPLHQHVKLQTLKVLTDRTISEIVEAALASHFEDLDIPDTEGTPST